MWVDSLLPQHLQYGVELSPDPPPLHEGVATPHYCANSWISHRIVRPFIRFRDFVLPQHIHMRTAVRGLILSALPYNTRE